MALKAENEIRILYVVTKCTTIVTRLIVHKQDLKQKEFSTSELIKTLVTLLSTKYNSDHTNSLKSLSLLLIGICQSYILLYILDNFSFEYCMAIVDNPTFINYLVEQIKNIDHLMGKLCLEIMNKSIDHYVKKK